MADAAAIVARERFADLFARGMRVFHKERFGAHDDARRAVAALEGIIIHKQLLQGIQLARFGIGQPLDGYNFAAVAIYRQQLAAGHGHVVLQHRAAAAGALAARALGAGQAQADAQGIHQLFFIRNSEPGFVMTDGKNLRSAVDLKGNGSAHECFSSFD